MAGAAASSVLARGARSDLEDKHQERVQYIEDIVQGLKDKGEREQEAPLLYMIGSTIAPLLSD